jgi:hypothetical protein
MSSDDTLEQLRADIDSGRTGVKVSAPDSAMAPRSGGDVGRGEGTVSEELAGVEGVGGVGRGALTAMKLAFRHRAAITNPRSLCRNFRCCPRN